MILPLKDARQTSFFKGKHLFFHNKGRKNNSSKSTKLWIFFPCHFYVKLLSVIISIFDPSPFMSC